MLGQTAMLNVTDALNTDQTFSKYEDVLLTESEYGDIDTELVSVAELMRSSLNAPDSWPATAASLYHLNVPGSQLRARLALLSGMAFGASIRHRIAAAAASELIHNASLVHDDLCDGDAQRRGQATVWKRYNPNVALCSGDMMLTAAFRAALVSDSSSHQLALLQLLTDRTSQVIGGQSIEVAKPRVPTETSFVNTAKFFTEYQKKVRLTDYLQATLAKTAPLIALPLEAGALGGKLTSEEHDRIRYFANAVGLAYQIIDDLDDVDVNHLSHCWPSKFHDYHAWPQHWPLSDKRSGNPVAIAMQRAVRHASASLSRAEKLIEHFPDQLATALAAILAKLRQQLVRHDQSIAGCFHLCPEDSAT
ncbi:polyprenyl synthetase family protein [Salinivibrio socompensis]|uniref:polyprenyl synthetase family protein n=1 Tax=Salinivibrio socompensis TaxID=1510206 RepID=UPI0013E2E53B|nr:polyprenyl synthetase family protein [Salinivibrio socompensis]